MPKRPQPENVTFPAKSWKPIGKTAFSEVDGQGDPVAMGCQEFQHRAPNEWRQVPVAPRTDRGQAASSKHTHAEQTHRMRTLHTKISKREGVWNDELELEIVRKLGIG